MPVSIHTELLEEWHRRIVVWCKTVVFDGRGPRMTVAINPECVDISGYR